MNENVIAPNVPKETALTKIATASGVEKTKAQYVLDKFTKFFSDAADCEQAVAEIVVTDASQVAMISKAKTTRLKLKEIRCTAENVRKELKAGILVEGKLIDSMYNIIEGITKPLEAKLQEQEDFVERQEAKRKAELAAERLEKITPYLSEGVQYDLGNMTQETFDSLLKNSKIAKEAIDAAKAREEQDRIDRETKEREERERIAAENEKLRKENEEQKAAAEKAEAEKQRIINEANEKAALAEKEKLAEIEAEKEKTRLVNEQLENEKRIAREKAEAEEKEKQRIADEAKQKAAKILAASDSEKIQMYFEQLLAVNAPVVFGGTANGILTGTKEKLEALKKYAFEKMEVKHG
jgi:hypothetical protein